ncbi:MAG: uridine-cytidine kinase [Planctomycetes bacterium]|nr:uridine-cytidine kinase [Planctomycetota bacterium]
MSHGKPYLVGIVGGSASGKTSFLDDLVRLLPVRHCAVLSQDNYYRPKEEQERDAQGQPNFDLPGAIQAGRLLRDLHCLLAGETIAKTEYTFNQRDRRGRLIIVDPAPVILLEGLFLFHFAEIRALFDLRVFIDAAEDVCKQRRLQRDAVERGYLSEHVEYQWENHVLPAYRQFVLPYREQAHVVVANHESYEKGLDVVMQYLREVG